MLHRRPFRQALFCLALGSPLAAGQSWEILDEIDFAQNMARHRLFALATEYLEDVAASDLDGDDRLSLLYAKASVSRWGGDFAETADKRLNFYQESVDLYGDFLNKTGDDHPRRTEARQDLAAANRSLGALRRALADAGIDAENNKKAAEAAFREAIKTLNAILNETRADLDAYLEEAAEVEEEDEGAEDQVLTRTIQAYVPLSEIAQTYYEWAQLYDQGEFNREDYLTKSIEAAEEFVWEVGTNVFISFRVYYYEALAYMTMGQLDEANTYLNFILAEDTGLPIFFVDGEGDPIQQPQFFVNQVTSLTELCYLAMAENYNASQEYEKTVELAEQLNAFYEKYEKQGVEPTDAGDEFMLELGMAEFRLGKPTGMPKVQKVAEAHPSDAIGNKAKEYISTILEGGGTEVATVIPPTIWMAGADTDRAESRPLDAIDKYHRALAAPWICDRGRGGAHVPWTALDAWSAIGNIYRAEKAAYLEAAVAFQEGPGT